VRHYVKHYRSAEACAAAAAHYWWLAQYQPPLQLPELISAGGAHLEFHYIEGRDAAPDDIPEIAAELGEAHRAMHATELHDARLDRPHAIRAGFTIPDFVTPRRKLIRRLLDAKAVPEPIWSPAESDSVLTAASAEPAAVYKDANLRNVIISCTGPVTVDFDDLTLAPFGYDLGKLLLSAALTWGSRATGCFVSALDAYNGVERNADQTACTAERLQDWIEIHYILTGRYLGRHGYWHSWPRLRRRVQLG
jgi:Ser/Thr protein kinase RdoA (MazF antagonist)